MLSHYVFQGIIHYIVSSLSLRTHLFKVFAEEVSSQPRRVAGTPANLSGPHLGADPLGLAGCPQLSAAP